MTHLDVSKGGVAHDLLCDLVGCMVVGRVPVHKAVKELHGFLVRSNGALVVLLEVLRVGRGAWSVTCGMTCQWRGVTHL